MARSVNAAAVGPVGSLSYELPDGLQLNISFDQEFLVGQRSQFVAAQGGARAGAYTVSLDCSWETWHGGGARWTVDLTLSLQASEETRVHCEYTR